MLLQEPPFHCDIAIGAQATYFAMSALLSWTSITYWPLSKSPRVMPGIVVVLLPRTMLVKPYLGAGSGAAHVPAWIWIGCEPF